MEQDARYLVLVTGHILEEATAKYKFSIQIGTKYSIFDSSTSPPIQRRSTHFKATAKMIKTFLRAASAVA
jgi:hypothetical protein